MNSWASALSWKSSPVAVIAGQLDVRPGGQADGEESGALIDDLRTDAKRARLDVLAGVQGSRLIVVLGGPADPLSAAARVAGRFGGGPLGVPPHFRVLGEKARVGQPEIALGVIPGGGGTQRLPRLIGPAKAKDLIFTGRPVGAAEALATGLADKVVPDAEVYAAAQEMAAQYAAGPALALAAAKHAVNRGLEVDLAAGLEIERLLFAGLFSTEDQKAGMRSFVENGPGKAVFEGR